MGRGLWLTLTTGESQRKGSPTTANRLNGGHGSGDERPSGQGGWLSVKSGRECGHKQRLLLGTQWLKGELYPKL